MNPEKLRRQPGSRISSGHMTVRRCTRILSLTFTFLRTSFD